MEERRKEIGRGSRKKGKKRGVKIKRKEVGEDRKRETGGRRVVLSVSAKKQCQVYSMNVLFTSVLQWQTFSAKVKIFLWSSPPNCASTFKYSSSRA